MATKNKSAAKPVQNQTIDDEKKRLNITASNDELKALVKLIEKAEAEAEFLTYRQQLRANANIQHNHKGESVKK